jgi:hypothetical protein
MPGISYLIKADAPRYTIVAATPQLLSLAGLVKEEVVGRGVFEVFPSNPNDPSDTGETTYGLLLRMYYGVKSRINFPFNAMMLLMRMAVLRSGTGRQKTVLSFLLKVRLPISSIPQKI